MNTNKKVLTTIIITTILILMFPKKIATYLNKTPFGSISDRLFNLISNLEGSYLSVPIWDFKQWSVGYGSGYNWDQKRPVNKTDIIDKDTAKRWLLTEAQDKYEFVINSIKVPVTDNQLLALSSFTYNIGENAFLNSTLLRLLNEGKSKDIVAKEFDKWINAGGKPSNGLINRRNAEKRLFLS
jgi:lysozyme